MLACPMLAELGGFIVDGCTITKFISIDVYYAIILGFHVMFNIQPLLHAFCWSSPMLAV